MQSRYTQGHGKKTRVDGRRMGAAQAVAARSKTCNWATSPESSAGRERYFMGAANWRALARFAGALRQVDDGLQSVATLAQNRGLGTYLAGSPAASAGGRTHRMGNPVSGRHDCARPPTRRWRKKSSAEAEALGRSHGGLSTKLHLRVDGHGRLLHVVLTPGQAREVRVATRLFDPGTPARRPKRVIADKGYGSRAFRAYLRRRGIRYTIPHMRHERYPGPFNSRFYRLRHHIERLINRFKQFRRIATRYDKLADTYRTAILIVAIRLAL